MMKLAMVLLAVLLLSITVSAAVNLTATVTGVKPTVGQMQICTGSCSDGTVSIDPATEFTVKVAVTDPNGQTDINADGFRLEFFTATDANGTAADWDHNTFINIASSTANGCVADANTFCFTVTATSWNTKFKAGSAKVYVRAKDNEGMEDSNTAAIVSVNNSTGITQDAAAATFSGAPGSNGNAILTDQAKAYVITTNSGNVDLNCTITDTNLSYLTYSIDKTKLKWKLSDDYGTSTPFTGGADVVNTNFGRGTDPTSGTFNTYMWLDIPAAQAPGNYTGTLTFGATAS